jgi:hypothetical protein
MSKEKVSRLLIFLIMNCLNIQNLLLKELLFFKAQNFLNLNFK